MWTLYHNVSLAIWQLTPISLQLGSISLCQLELIISTQIEANHLASNMLHLVFHKRLACGWPIANWSSKKDGTKQISTVSIEKNSSEKRKLVAIKLVWVCDINEMLGVASTMKFITT